MNVARPLTVFTLVVVLASFVAPGAMPTALRSSLHTSPQHYTAQSVTLSRNAVCSKAFSTEKPRTSGLFAPHHFGDFRDVCNDERLCVGMSSEVSLASA